MISVNIDKLLREFMNPSYLCTNGGDDDLDTFIF